MTDNELIRVVRGFLVGELASDQMSVLVIQKQNPTQQGVPNTPCLFIEKLFDTPRGHPEYTKVYQQSTNSFVETEKQLMATTFQISALVLQIPENTNLPTASDMANYALGKLQSRKFLRVLEPLDLGVLRAPDVRNPYFTDDRDRQEAAPSFDIAVTHYRTTTTNSPIVTTAEVDLYRV
jgi:hypothetical protein